MFISFCKEFIRRLKMNPIWKRGIAYGIVVFLVMQCYTLPFATEKSSHMEEYATIGDATWTTAVTDTEPSTEENPEIYENQIAVYSAASDLYRIEPDMSQPFVVYAMTIARGSGINQSNLCATYVSKALYGYYGEQAPVSGMTRVIQISEQLEKTGNWECVYRNVNCFSSAKTDAQYDSLFDSLTNSGDIVCFVNQSETDQVHCAIAGGGAAMIGHLTSSGWDSVRASYYLANAVDDRKICTGMLVYRYKEAEKTGTIRVCKNYDEELYRSDPKVFDIGGANYAVYDNLQDAQMMQNEKGFCYVEPGEAGQVAQDNVSCNAKTGQNGTGEPVSLPEGVYYIREVTAPVSGSWMIDPNIYETKIIAGQRTTLGLPRDKEGNSFDPGSSDYMDCKLLGPEKPLLGYICLKKQVEDIYKDSIEKNGNYNYDGIEYTVYRVSGNNQYDVTSPCGVFRADAQGQAMVASSKYDTSCVGTMQMGLPIGWYLIQETKTNESMELNTTPKWIEVSGGETVIQTVVMEDPPKIAKPGLLLRKYGEDGHAVAHAKYRICYYSVSMDYDPAEAGEAAERTWIFQTDTQGELRFGEETEWYVEGDRFFTDKDGTIMLPAGTVTIQEIEAPVGYVLDSTVYVKKITPGDTRQVLSIEQVVTVTEKIVRGDLEFQKTNEDGQPLANMKFMITDENGESHVVWTDEEGYYSTASSYISHKRETNSEASGSGIWFGNSEVDDQLGALPFGSYTIEELRCAANKDTYRTMRPVTVEITEHGSMVNLGTFVNYRFPEITTKAEWETGTETSCVDHVWLNNLETGHRYTVMGEPRRKDTGEVLDQSLWSCEKKILEATETNVEADVIYTIQTDVLSDTELVFFEYVTDEAYPDEIIAQHTDIEDKEQTIYIPPKEYGETEPKTTVAGVSTEDVLQKSSDHVIQTGDESRLFLMILIVATSAVGVGMGIIGRIHKRKRK